MHMLALEVMQVLQAGALVHREHMSPSGMTNSAKQASQTVSLVQVWQPAEQTTTHSPLTRE